MNTVNWPRLLPLFCIMRLKKCEYETLRHHCYLWLSIPIHTAKYQQYHQSGIIKLVSAKENTRLLTKNAFPILKKIYRPKFPYKRARLVLSELSRIEHHQHDLFNESQNDQLAVVMDEINQSFGRDVIVPRRLMGNYNQWKMRQANLSPAYTTDWGQLIQVF